MEANAQYEFTFDYRWTRYNRGQPQFAWSGFTSSVNDRTPTQDGNWHTYTRVMTKNSTTGNGILLVYPQETAGATNNDIVQIDNMTIVKISE